MSFQYKWNQSDCRRIFRWVKSEIHWKSFGWLIAQVAVSDQLNLRSAVFFPNKTPNQHQSFYKSESARMVGEKSQQKTRFEVLSWSFPPSTHHSLFLRQKPSFVMIYESVPPQKRLIKALELRYSQKFSLFNLSNAFLLLTLELFRNIYWKSSSARESFPPFSWKKRQAKEGIKSDYKSSARSFFSFFHHVSLTLMLFEWMDCRGEAAQCGQKLRTWDELSVWAFWIINLDSLP